MATPTALSRCRTSALRKWFFLGSRFSIFDPVRLKPFLSTVKKLSISEGGDRKKLRRLSRKRYHFPSTTYIGFSFVELLRIMHEANSSHSVE
jgi:hypothetical protein